MYELQIWIGYEILNILVGQLYFLIYHLTDISITNFCLFSGKLKIRTADVMVMSSGKLRHVDQESVDLARNWTRAVVLLARGHGGEHGERQHWTIWSPEGRRRSLERSSAVGARRQEDTKGEKEDQGILEGQHLTLSVMEWSGKAGGDRRRHGGARRRPADADRDEDAGADLSDPGPIPCAGRSSTARRS